MGATNRHLTLDLGTRYERVRTKATGDIIGADTDTWVPRLAATYDLRGDGRWVAQATYAHYAGKYSEAQFTSNTDVGNPSLVIYGVHRAGRAGPRLRARASTRRTTATSSSGASPPRTCSSRMGCRRR